MGKLKSRILGIKNFFVSPKLPENPGGKILIHLGCGDIASPEFINVDVRPGPHIHFVRDVTDLAIFEKNWSDLIYACHILEHISHRNIENVLWEWRRVLKKGGVLRLSVPDFDKIVHIYECSSRDINSIIKPLMGGQGYKDNVHRSAFNQKYLTEKLMDVGFREIRQWDPDKVSNHEFQDWASSIFKANDKKYQISLNIEAVK